MSKKQGIRYRDTIAAPGSSLYEAIVDSTSAPSPEGRALAAKKARKLYDESNASFKQVNPNWVAFP